MDYMHDLLQDLSSMLDTDSSGGESAGEEEKKEEIVDEDDQAERAKLPQYASRFKVCACCVKQCFLSRLGMMGSAQQLLRRLSHFNYESKG